MVQARLDTLSSDAKRVLRAASIFGIGFARDDVSALISDRNLPALDAALEALVAREVILPEGTDHYVFRHALLREAAYAMLTEGDRGLGHLLAGEWLEKSAARDPLILVEHFERGGDRQRAARWCRQAADEALARSDLPGAIARARRGVALGATGALRAGLRLCEAQAHFWRGEYAMGEDTASDGIACATEGDELWFHCVGELAGALGQQGRYDQVATWAATAEKAVPRDGAADAQVACLIRAAGYLLRAGDDVTTESMVARVESTVGDAARLPPRLAARYQAVQAMRRLRQGDPAGAIDLLQAALASASQTGDTGTMCDLRVNKPGVGLGRPRPARHRRGVAAPDAGASADHRAPLHHHGRAHRPGPGPDPRRPPGRSAAAGDAGAELRAQAGRSARRGGRPSSTWRPSASWPARPRVGAAGAARRRDWIAVAARERSGRGGARSAGAGPPAGGAGAGAERPRQSWRRAPRAGASTATNRGAPRAGRGAVRDRRPGGSARRGPGSVGAAARARGQLANPEWRRSFLTGLPDNARVLALARDWGLTEDSRPVRIDASVGTSALGTRPSS